MRRTKETAGTQPQTTREYWKAKDRHRGRTKTRKPALSLDEKIQKHRKKFK